MAENKTILICGATGFIGRNLLDYYYKQGNYNIKAVHYKRPAIKEYDVEWLEYDLRNPENVKKAVEGVDIILQFAATTTGAKDIVSKPYIHVTDNAVMNSLILREAFEQGIEHFIFPSCTIMYQKSEVAIKELDFNPSEEILPFYFGAGYTKIYLEKMCEFYSRLGKTKHTVIRHSNMYGPHDKYDLEKSHVFGATITKVMTSKDGKINVWGTGEEIRDLLYIEDLVHFIDIAINKQTTSYELFNVGLGEGIKIKDLVYKIVKYSEHNLEIVHDLSKPTIPTSLYLDCTRAKEILGWKPKYTLDEGIIKTINWYKNNIK
jgi:nucleoside-diphosphate-sugar epimerase